jgi:diguanylate cyclase (GGDEF)-like protein
MVNLSFLLSRLRNRADAEHLQVAIRLAIVTTAVFYFYSAYFARNATHEEYVVLARWAVSISFAVTIALFVALMLDPGISVTRRVIGLVHDVTAISAAMFLGEAGAAAVAAIYLWVTLGNGFRYGISYLYGCAALSIVGFGAVYYFSEYWRSEVTLSVNILILLTVIPPYVASLLKSLQTAKAQLKQQASTDRLTGLMNRAELERSLEAILAQQHAGHFLLFCDLDHFKKVNDIAGHAAGDKPLADIGQIIRDCVRGDDLTARLGGDEFCVFVKRCPLVKAREIAENIRNSVSGYRLAWGTEYYRVGISVGAAPSAAVKDLNSLFRLADAACYAAKNAGRNQVHVVDPDNDLADTQSVRRMFTDKPTAGKSAVSASNRPTESSA